MLSSKITIDMSQDMLLKRDSIMSNEDQAEKQSRKELMQMTSDAWLSDLTTGNEGIEQAHHDCVLKQSRM